MGGMFSARTLLGKSADMVRSQNPTPPPPTKGAQMAATGAAPDATLLGGGGTSTMLTGSQGLAGLGDTTKKQLLGS